MGRRQPATGAPGGPGSARGRGPDISPSPDSPASLCSLRTEMERVQQEQGKVRRGRVVSWEEQMTCLTPPVQARLEGVEKGPAGPRLSQTLAWCISFRHSSQTCQNRGPRCCGCRPSWRPASRCRGISCDCPRLCRCGTTPLHPMGGTWMVGGLSPPKASMSLCSGLVFPEAATPGYSASLTPVLQGTGEWEWPPQRWCWVCPCGPCPGGWAHAKGLPSPFANSTGAPGTDPPGGEPAAGAQHPRRGPPAGCQGHQGHLRDQAGTPLQRMALVQHRTGCCWGPGLSGWGPRPLRA